MELLLFGSEDYNKNVIINLHSNMELLLFTTKFKKYLGGLKFTFQYGATTILSLNSSLYLIPLFTFQYGATTMRPLLNSDFLIVYPLFLSISIFCKFYRYFQIKYLDLFNP